MIGDVDGCRSQRSILEIIPLVDSGETSLKEDGPPQDYILFISDVWVPLDSTKHCPYSIPC